MGELLEVGAFIVVCAVFLLLASSGGGDGNYPGSKGS
jgi:hypothetical protein